MKNPQVTQINDDGVRVAVCSCGEEFQWLPAAGEHPEEYAHYVWAVRRDGTRSNLGYCPVTHGLSVAMRKARTALMSGFAEYQGERY